MAWRSAVDLEARQEQVRAALGGVLEGLSDEVAMHPPMPGQPSIAELLAHLVLTERRLLSDVELMLTEEWPELPSIGPLEEPERLRALARSLGSTTALLAAYDEAAAAVLDLLRGLDEEQELRGGHGPELGNVTICSYALMNAIYHEMGHVEEMRAVRRALGLGGVPLARRPGLASL